MAILWGKEYTRQEILQRVGNIRQLAKAESFELTEGAERGVRAVRLYNAAGIDLTVVPDRGMSLMELTLNGTPLPFFSSVGIAHPAFYEPGGAGWLRTWPGGFSTPCGLTQVGSPGTDEGEDLGLHGRAANLPAREVRCGGLWQKDNYTVWAEGKVVQTAMFGEHISLHRRVWMWLGDPRIWIEDTVENQGFEPTPFMLLQHFNLGFPLVDVGSQLKLPLHSTQPVDDEARANLDQCLTFEAPRPHCPEQVFYHDLTADASGMVEVKLVNPAFEHSRGLGVTWKYLLKDYPVLAEWKMMGEGNYVVGVEPANCHVEGRAAERQRGSLQTLLPGEVRKMMIEIGFNR